MIGSKCIGRKKICRSDKFNFNFVLTKFTGSYFMRMGDDDWLDSNYIESCLNFLNANPEYVCAYGQTKLFNLNNEFVKYDVDLSLEDEVYLDRMVKYYNNVLQNGIYFGLIKREYISIMRNDIKIAEDWLAVARLCFKGKIKMLTESNLNMSLGGGGGSVESIVQALGLSKFDKFFPYLAVCKNAVLDILWISPIYKEITFSKRVALAKACSNANL